MPGKRRSTSQLARDRRVISDLYLQGWLQADIAAKLNISQATVSNDLKAIQKGWLTSTLIDFNEAKAREIAKVDRLEREYWRAWEKSCEETGVGDPRFLQGVQWCIDRRCKILGIDKAIPAYLMSLDLSRLPQEALERLAAGEEPLHVLAHSTASEGGA